VNAPAGKTNFSPSLKIVEGVESLFVYHLSKTGNTGKTALCGNRHVMHTEVPLSTWGMKTHLDEKYCSVCEVKGKFKK
jgi:hypothetical protein